MSFWTIFSCRVMVGVGEATLGPAAISLLADYFPPAKRATVTSIYSMGIAVGAGLAATSRRLFQSFGWREAFYDRRFSGNYFCRFGFFSARTAARTKNRPDRRKLFSTDWKKLISNKSFILLCIGYALLGLATNNLSIWGATFYSRVIKFDLPTIGFYGGILTLAAGIPATLFGGVFCRLVSPKSSAAGECFTARFFRCFVPFWLFSVFTTSLSDSSGKFRFAFRGSGVAWRGGGGRDGNRRRKFARAWQSQFIFSRSISPLI